MPNYRRNYVPGGTYFFTVVTLHRRRFLTSDLARTSLRFAFRDIREKWPFTIDAIVLLPDHLHAVWTLPRGDDKYPIRWKRIKEQFTRRYLDGGGDEASQTTSRMRQTMRGIWHKRYWEHTCEGEEDMKHCVDYVHFNPKKHGLVGSVVDWRWSSFHRYVRLGEYTNEWGHEDPTPGFDTPEWGP